MNVRFFAGTRAQYDALAIPRNPQALYFCSDTNELFWGDRLLTDGMRVVPTYADLPTPDKAADGVVYYVTETRNGYVVPHSGKEWLQTIYAPLRKGESVVPGEEDSTVTTVGAVNDIVEQIYKDMDERFANIEIDDSAVHAISFAGVKLEEVDGVFAIDRRCAREALGLIMPEGMEDKAVEFATKADIPSIDCLASEQYVDEKFAAIEIPEVPTKISELENDINYITAADIPEIDLSNHYNKSETETLINEAVSGIEIPDTSEFITIEDVEAKGYLTEHQSLDKYAKKSEVPSIEGLASESYVDEKFASVAIPEIDLSEYAKISDIPSHEGLATENFVKNEIAKAQLEGGEADLSGLATKDELQAVEALIPDITNFATRDELPSIEGLASIEYVDEKTASIVIPEIPTNVSVFTNDAGYLTEHQDLSEYDHHKAVRNDSPQYTTSLHSRHYHDYSQSS